MYQIFSFNGEIFFLHLVRETMKIIPVPLLIFHGVLDIFQQVLENTS